MKESSFWAECRTNMPNPFWMRIENAVVAGIADVIGCFKGSETWIELKVFHGEQILVRHSQLAWMRSRYQAGCTGNVFVLAWHPAGLRLYKAPQILIASKTPGNRVIKDGVWMNPGEPWKHFPRPIKWKQLMITLFNIHGEL